MEKGERRGKINYELLYKIEEKYGKLSDVPEDDEDLMQLRIELNIPPEGIGESKKQRRKRKFEEAKRERELARLAGKDE